MLNELEMKNKERDELVETLWPDDQKYQEYMKKINFVGRIYTEDCREEPLGCCYSDGCSIDHCVRERINDVESYEDYMERVCACDEDEDEDEELDNELYFILDTQSNSIKIGVSKDVKRRLSQLQTSNASPLLLVGRMQNRIGLEKNLHEKFKKYRLKGEWFSTNASLIEYISELGGG